MKFYEAWTEKDIEAYVKENNVLVLFGLHGSNSTAEIMIYGNMKDSQKKQLLEKIVNHFGGAPLTDSLCGKINEYAEKWYNKEILRRKARVINIKRK